MKNFLRIITLALAGLVLNTSIASASIFSMTKGENPCLFSLSNLQHNGYQENKAYTIEEIRQLLTASDIKMGNVETLKPGQTYQLVYSCYVDHQLAHASVQALPINNPAHAVTLITWSATKPS